MARVYKEYPKDYKLKEGDLIYEEYLQIRKRLVLFTARSSGVYKTKEAKLVVLRPGYELKNKD